MPTDSTTDTGFDNGSEQLFPHPIRDLMPIARAFNADPLAIAAAGFAVAAAAMGASYRIAVPNAAPVFPGFNLALVGSHDRGLPWLHLVQYPFLRLVHEMTTAWGEDGGRAVAKMHSGRKSDLIAATTTGQSPELLRIAEMEVLRLESAQKPFVITGSVDPKDIAALTTRIFDSMITVHSSGSDFFQEIFELKPKDRRELIRLLNVGWKGTPGRAPFVHVIATAATPARTAANVLIGVPNPPPVLFLPVNPVPRIPAALDTAEWNNVINVLFNVRCSRPNKLITFTAEAEVAFAEYAQELGPDPWLADLARRIAFLIAFMDGTEFSVDAARRGIAITRALAAAHDSAVAAMRPQTAVEDVSARLEEKLLALITAKSPLSRQQLWRSLDHPKAESFNAALQALTTRGDVLVENKLLTVKT